MIKISWFNLKAALYNFFTKDISFMDILPPKLRVKVNNHYRLSVKQKIYLFRQLSYLIDSGYSIEKSLIKIMGKFEKKRFTDKNSGWNRAVRRLIRSVRDTGSLANALEELNAFRPEIIYQATGGELSGRLPEVLLDISKGFETNDNISRNLKIMMIYPSVVMAVLIGSMHIMSKVVMPEIMLLADEVGADISTLSKVVISVSGFIADKGSYLLLFMLLAVIAFLIALKRKSVRSAWDGLLLKSFMIKDIIRAQELIRYCKVFAALFDSGVELEITFDCAANAIKNYILRERALAVKNMVLKDGVDFAMALSRTEIFDDTEIQLIDIGAGVSVPKLCEVFETLAIRATRELDAKITAIMAAIEPASIIFLGVIVGLFVIGIYSPVYSVISHM